MCVSLSVALFHSLSPLFQLTACFESLSLSLTTRRLTGVKTSSPRAPRHVCAPRTTQSGGAPRRCTPHFQASTRPVVTVPPPPNKKKKKSARVYPSGRSLKLSGKNVLTKMSRRRWEDPSSPAGKPGAAREVVDGWDDLPEEDKTDERLQARAFHPTQHVFPLNVRST